MKGDLQYRIRKFLHDRWGFHWLEHHESCGSGFPFCYPHFHCKLCRHVELRSLKKTKEAVKA